MADKLEELKQKKAAIDRAIAREKHKAKNAQRKIDDKKKILVGAFVLEQLQKSGTSPELLSFSEKRFSDWLVRDSDREIFGLKATRTT